MSRVDIRVARKYARALFDALELQKLEETSSLLNEFAQVWNGSSDLRTALLQPSIPEGQRRLLLEDIVKSVAPSNGQLAALVMVLFENQRIALVPGIAEAFTFLVEQARKTLSLECTTASVLPSGDKAQFEEVVRRELGSLSKITWREDGSLIAGMVVRSHDHLLDGSLSGALSRIRDELVN